MDRERNEDITNEFKIFRRNDNVEYNKYKWNDRTERCNKIEVP